MKLIASFLLAVPALAHALSSPDGQLQVDVGSGLKWRQRLARAGAKFDLKNVLRRVAQGVNPGL